MKRVGYGIVGLAMVLLGIVIIVPFLKSSFPQLDGYITYSADVMAAAQANNADILKNIMNYTDDSLKIGIAANTERLAKLAPNDPNATNLKNIIEVSKMAVNAMNGDQETVDTINKTLVGAKLPPWQPPPSPVIPSATPSDVITYTSTNRPSLNNLVTQLSPYSLKKNIADMNKNPPSPGTTTLIGFYTLVYAAKMGDPNALAIVNKNLTDGGYPTVKLPSQPAPAPVPSLSVNTARPSSTLDMLKTACQSLLADATAPLK